MKWKDELRDTSLLPSSALDWLLHKQPFCSVLNKSDCDIKSAALKDVMWVIGLLAGSVSGKSSIVFRMRRWDNRMLVTHPARVWTFMWIDSGSHFRLVSGVCRWRDAGRKGQWGKEMKANSWSGRSVTLSFVALSLSLLQQITANAFRLCAERSGRWWMWKMSLANTWGDLKGRFTHLISVSHGSWGSPTLSFYCLYLVYLK